MQVCIANMLQMLAVLKLQMIIKVLFLFCVRKSYMLLLFVIHFHLFCNVFTKFMHAYIYNVHFALLTERLWYPLYLINLMLNILMLHSCSLLILIIIIFIYGKFSFKCVFLIMSCNLFLINSSVIHIIEENMVLS